MNEIHQILTYRKEAMQYISTLREKSVKELCNAKDITQMIYVLRVFEDHVKFMGESLQWLENQFQGSIGCGEAHDVICDVHKGGGLLETLRQHLPNNHLQSDQKSAG